MPGPDNEDLTLPLCDACWAWFADRYFFLPLDPIRTRERAEETCARCRVTMRSGIYVRATPDDLRNPEPS